MTLAHALFTRWLPAECGYVLRFRGRRRRTPVKETADELIGYR
jgi:hypothetical protein